MRQVSARARIRSFAFFARGPDGALRLSARAVGVLAFFCGACVHPEAARGRHALDERAYGVASTALRSAVRARPDELSYWVDLGRAYVGQGDAQRAQEAFTRAIALEPGAARLHVYLGHALELARSYDQAEVEYRRAVALDPNRAWPLRVLGARLLKWGRFEAAVPVLERAVQLDPQHAETHNALAIALAKAGRREAAEARFRSAYARFPDERSLALGLGALLVDSGRTRDALELYTRMAERWPTLAPLHVARALLHEQLGDLDAARAALAEALKLAPQNQDYRRRLAELARPSAPRGAATAE